MKILFKKKNTNTEDVSYFIDEGSVITENYNETLDSAVIRLSHLNQQLNIEPYDKIVLIDEEGRLQDRYMCIDTYTETLECLDPKIYSYEISLFSETKELEGIILPNLSITQLTNGNHRTVWYYLNLYLNQFDEKIKSPITTPINTNALINRHKFADRVQTRFNSIDCPEMQWNAPTLREVLNDLMMVDDCIPVMRNNVIDFIDLTEQRNDISNNAHINYVQRSQSSEDYVSELKMNMVNIMQTKVSGVKNSVKKVNYCMFTTNSNILTDSNMFLKTSHPINRIISLRMYRPILVAPGEVVSMYYCDLADIAENNEHYRLVYEKQEYDCLSIPQWAYSSENHSISELSQLQPFCVYYERGSNIISGFTNLIKNTPASFLGSSSAFYLILDLITKKKKWIYAGSGPAVAGITAYYPGTNIGNSYFSTFFMIEYETLEDTVFSASKDIAPTHNRVVVDNQTNSYVDSYNQGFMEYQKANRLGNQQLHINARYENDWNNLIRISDYYEDSVIYQCQYQIYKNHIEVNAIATKNYILRDYFTGVKAKIRSWKIADGSDALIRNELLKYYLEFSFKSKDEELYLTTKPNPYNFLSFFDEESPLTINYCLARFYTKTGSYYPDSTNYYALDLVGRIIGNSLVFNFQTEDNFGVGKRLTSEVTSNEVLSWSKNQGSDWEPFRIKAQDWSNKYGGIKLEPLRYVDLDSEVEDFSFVLLSSISNVFPYTGTNEMTNDEQKKLIVNCGKRPIVYNNEILDRQFSVLDLPINKDNREILGISIQFELCSDTHNIVFTKKFLELQRWARVGEIDLTKISVRYGSIDGFNFKNLTLDNTNELVGASIVIAQESTTISKLEITGTTSNSNRVYYICYDGNILLAIKGNTTIYLNSLKTRDYNIYDIDGNIIDSI